MPTAVAAPGSRRFSREDVVRLGQAGRAWEFLPVGMQAARLAPEDWGLRVLLAANLAKLGLKTLAAEQVAAMPESVRTDDSVRGLVAAVGGMAQDRIGLAELEATTRVNLEALAGRGVDLRGELDRWKTQMGKWEWFRAADGNVVRRRGEQWRGLADQRAAAAAFGREHLSKPNPPLSVFTVEGIDPPWLLQEVARRAERNKEGFWARLLVVQADTQEFLDGLAQADLSEVLGQERTVVFVGADATERLLEDLRGRLDGRLIGAYIPQAGVREKASPPVQRVLGQVEAEQLAEHGRLVREVRAIYAGRDRAWWHRRFEEAHAGGEPLRILVPSCRYTTFVKHAGADLVEAFGRAGHRAELLIEADDHSGFTSVSYLRAIERLRPDLLVVVNYTRRNLGEWLPEELPFVCWIQDAMPHLFDGAVGANQTCYDFLAGHVFEEMSRRFGYPPQRSLTMPVAASAVKFHDAPVASRLRHVHECEIALVSHHSETPERMHERLLDEEGRGSPIRRVLEELGPRVVELASDPMRGPMHRALEEVSRAALRKHLGREPDARMLALAHKNYCLPLADRVLRHQTLAWAADLARERGWRLHVYGRGWEKHPRFAPFARGELAHGEELRAAYQCASVHLHASINTMAHQRVMECALSGGLPLCRLTFEVLRPIAITAEMAAAWREPPTVADPERRRHGHFIIDHPEAAAYTAMLQRLGRPVDDFFWVHDKFRAPLRQPPAPAPAHEHNPSAFLLGDLGETTFESRERLAELVERAIACPGWRAGWSGLIAKRVRERFTHEVFARRTLDLVRAWFAGTGD